MLEAALILAATLVTIINLSLTFMVLKMYSEILKIRELTKTTSSLFKESPVARPPGINMNRPPEGQCPRCQGWIWRDDEGKWTPCHCWKP